MRPFVDLHFLHQPCLSTTRCVPASQPGQWRTRAWLESDPCRARQHLVHITDGASPVSSRQPGLSWEAAPFFPYVPCCLGGTHEGLPALRCPLPIRIAQLCLTSHLDPHAASLLQPSDSYNLCCHSQEEQGGEAAASRDGSPDEVVPEGAAVMRLDSLQLPSEGRTGRPSSSRIWSSAQERAAWISDLEQVTILSAIAPLFLSHTTVTCPCYIEKCAKSGCLCMLKAAHHHGDDYCNFHIQASLTPPPPSPGPRSGC